MSTRPIYDPFEFIDKVELFTLAMLGSFFTWKFLNAIYDSLCGPVIDTIINSDKTDKYYIKIGTYYIQTDMIFREFIKWLVLILILMIIYNLLTKNKY